MTADLARRVNRYSGSKLCHKGGRVHGKFYNLFALMIILNAHLVGCSGLSSIKGPNGNVVETDYYIVDCYKEPKTCGSDVYMTYGHAAYMIADKFIEAGDKVSASYFLSKACDDIGYDPVINCKIAIFVAEKNKISVVDTKMRDKLEYLVNKYPSVLDFRRSEQRHNMLHKVAKMYIDNSPTDLKKAQKYAKLSCESGCYDGCSLANTLNSSVDMEKFYTQKSLVREQDAERDTEELRRRETYRSDLERFERNTELLVGAINEIGNATVQGIDKGPTMEDIVNSPLLSSGSTAPGPQPERNTGNRDSYGSYTQYVNNGNGSEVNWDKTSCVRVVSAKYQEISMDQKNVLTVRLRNDCNETIKISLCIEQGMAKGSPWLCALKESTSQGEEMSYKGPSTTGKYRYMGCKKHPDALMGYSYGVCSAEPD